MRKIVGIVALLALNAAVYADMQPALPHLDKILFQVTAKQWVTTQTALLKVEINATLNNADLIHARKEIMDKLHIIAASDWHLTQFERSQDSSGLEKLTVEAETRLSQDKLSNIYADAKKVSKPGATYLVKTVEFKPSLEDIQQIKTTLREQLYQQVKAEMARINTVYTTQNYSLSRLIFVDGEAMGTTRPLSLNKMSTMAVDTAAIAPTLAVSNELIMTAMVEAASNRKGN